MLSFAVVRVAPAAAFALALAGAATAQRPGEPAGVGAICTRVVGVPEGEAHYEACVQSLAESSRGARERLAVWRREACRGASEATSSPLPAACAPGAANPAPATTSELPPDRTRSLAPPGGRRSYFAVSPGMAVRREQLACADLGFDPLGRAFSACVGNLRAALARADNPMN